MRRVLLILVALALAVMAACSRVGGIHSKHAVEEAIQAHLRQNPSLSLDRFTTEVEDVKFNGDMAEARVKFQSKQSARLSVEVGYGLRREGDHWEVVSSTPLSGQGTASRSPHGSVPGNGPGTPPPPQPSH